MVGVFDYFDVLAGLAQPDFYTAFSFHDAYQNPVPLSHLKHRITLYELIKVDMTEKLRESFLLRFGWQ